MLHRRKDALSKRSVFAEIGKENLAHFLQHWVMILRVGGGSRGIRSERGQLTSGKFLTERKVEALVSEKREVHLHGVVVDVMDATFGCHDSGPVVGEEDL